MTSTISAGPCFVVVKHTNPCGVASASGCGGDLLEAYRAAVRADPISAFGGRAWQILPATSSSKA